MLNRIQGMLLAGTKAPDLPTTGGGILRNVCCKHNVGSVKKIRHLGGHKPVGPPLKSACAMK